MIKFGMTIAEMITQLTRGFIKATGRNPDGLEKIKIMQEANQRFKDMNKVVDMQGRTLDPSKTITGGTQEGAALRSGIMRATGEGPREITEDTGEGFIDFVRRTDPEGAAKLQKEEDRIRAMIEAANKRAAKNLKNKKKKKDDPEEKAMGGRIGFKKGMDRRTFMKIMAGLTTLPVVGKFFKGAEVAAPVAEKAVKAAKGVPPYFFELVNKIKAFGEPRRTPSYRERVVEYQYTGKDGIEYELVEELDTGNIKITKDKIGGANYGDESFEVIEDRTEMNFVKGQGDEATRGTPADEYEEYKVEFDQDGTVADASEIDEVSKMEIIKEVTDEAPSIKKAGGGIARMLGE